MTITYMYKVISSTPEMKVMEVEYSAEGYPTITVGMPIPTDVADLPALIEAYSPVHRWIESTLPPTALADIPVGTSGVVVYGAPVAAAEVVDQATPESTTPIVPQPFEQMVAATLVKFGVLATDPTLVPAPVDTTAQ